MGGLGLPNIELYHMAFELTELSKFGKMERDLTKCIDLELNMVPLFKPLQMFSQME